MSRRVDYLLSPIERPDGAALRFPIPPTISDSMPTGADDWRSLRERTGGLISLRARDLYVTCSIDARLDIATRIGPR